MFDVEIIFGPNSLDLIDLLLRESVSWIGQMLQHTLEKILLPCRHQFLIVWMIELIHRLHHFLDY